MLKEGHLEQIANSTLISLEKRGETWVGLCPLFKVEVAGFTDPGACTLQLRQKIKEEFSKAVDEIRTQRLGEEKVRKKQANIRLTDSEYAILKLAAGSLNLDFSDFIRQTACTKAMQILKIEEAPALG